jgi:hypothetical protein
MRAPASLFPRIKGPGISLVLLVALGLVAAPAAQAKQTITFTLNLFDCAFSTTDMATSSVIPVRPGDVIELQTDFPTGTCFFVLAGGPPGAVDLYKLTGWSSLGVDSSPFVSDFTSASLAPFTLTVGLVNAWGYFVSNPDTGPAFPSDFIFFELESDSGVTVQPAQYSLGFEANGGQCTLTSSGPIFDGTWITVPTIQQCTRPGYRLLGWNPKSDGSDPLGFDPGGWTVMTGDNTLYAIWVPSASS